MAVSQGAAALLAATTLAVAVATLWWCGSGKWVLLAPQQRKAAPSDSKISPWRWAIRRWSSTTSQGPATRPVRGVKTGLVGLIGNTPLIRIQSLSDATGCEVSIGRHVYRFAPSRINLGQLVVDIRARLAPSAPEKQKEYTVESFRLDVHLDSFGPGKLLCSLILGKAEFLNPGGSVKDRVAVGIIEEALESGALRVGGLVTEGSAGSTGISLAMVASAFGCKCHVVIPDDAAVEKSQLLEALGANVERVRPVSITHKDHFVNIARRRAVEATISSNQISELAETRTAEEGGYSASVGQFENRIKGGEVQENGGLEKEANLKTNQNDRGGFFADQFENLANFRAHYEGTGPEIWEQTGGAVHAFVAAAGTGGTVAGVSCFLKERNPRIKCYLIDPPGSGLFNRVTRGVMYTREEAEGKRLKNPFDTITEGIGINRLTENFKLAQLDDAFRGTDREAVEMSRFLLKNDGLFIGSSSAMNCVGAVRVARLLGPKHTIVTILCDSGARHLSKFQNPEYLATHGLTPSANELEFING